MCHIRILPDYKGVDQEKSKELLNSLPNFKQTFLYCIIDDAKIISIDYLDNIYTICYQDKYGREYKTRVKK